MRTRGIVIGVVIACLAAPCGWAEDVSTTVRVFSLRNSSVQDASNAIQPLLSEHGSLTVQPRLARITVQDRPEVVAQIANIISALDRSRSGYRIRAELYEGTLAEAEAGSSDDVDLRVWRMFPYKAYRRLGVTILEGELGGNAAADFGPHYRLTFLPTNIALDRQWGMPDVKDRVSLHRLTLVRLDEDEDGVQQQTEVLKTSVALSPGQQAIFGASASETSERGLVLIVRADDVGGSEPPGDR